MPRLVNLHLGYRLNNNNKIKTVESIVSHCCHYVTTGFFVIGFEPVVLSASQSANSTSFLSCLKSNENQEVHQSHY